MKGARYVDGVLVTTEQLSSTDQNKGAAIKERFGSIMNYGVIDDGSDPFKVTYNTLNTSININSGEGYCLFNKDNTSPEHGNTGERIHLSQSISNLTIKDGPIASPDQRHIFMVYVEIHKDRKLDETNVAHYTQKVDSFVVAQLSDSQLNDLTNNHTVYVTFNLIPTIQSYFYALNDSELNDTFGEGKWKRETGLLYAGVTVTDYNSIYIGTATDGAIAYQTGTRTIPICYVSRNVLNISDLEEEIQGNHRVEQHSNGIIGGINALRCTGNSTGATDVLEINDLSGIAGAQEYAYIGGFKLRSGELAIGYRNIGVSSFTSGTGNYYIYVYIDTGTGVFKTKVSPTAITTNDHLLLGKCYFNASTSVIQAYENDKRYNSSGAANPIIDLRTFGTLTTNKINDEAKVNLASNNLISNGEFEQGVHGQAPTGWNGSGITLDDSNNIGGKFSLKLTPSAIAISDPIPYNKLSAYSLLSSITADAASTNISIGLRAYVGKDYSDVLVSDNSVDSINIGYAYSINNYTVSNGTWEEKSGRFNRDLSDEWSPTTLGSGGAHSFPSDIDKIKYVRVIIKHVSGSGNIFVDNIRLFNQTDFHHDNLTVDGDVSIVGDLTVNGTTTTINSTTLDVDDANITVNKGGNQATADDNAGITVEMSDATDARIVYDKDATSYFKVGLTSLEKEIADISSSQILTNKRLNSPIKIQSGTDLSANVTSENLNTLTGGGTTSLHSHIGGGAGGKRVQIFTSSGTFTPPSGVSEFYVELVGGGGGGGGGRRWGAEDGGGGGGGSGGVCYSFLTGVTSPVTVTIGANGVGGIGGVVSNTNGTAGGTTSFGGYFFAYGGAGGYKGSNLGGAGGGGGGGATGFGLYRANGGAGGNGGDIYTPGAQGTNGRYVSSFALYDELIGTGGGGFAHYGGGGGGAAVIPPSGYYTGTSGGAGGKGGTYTISIGSGGNALWYGCGGGGSSASNVTNSGGNGYSGIALIFW